MPNATNRVYESNGPDVKVRGTANHIAEKYQALSRDAHSSGDRVAAENYLQHAEHYLRIIAASQAQMTAQSQQQSQPSGNDAGADDGDDTTPAPAIGSASETADEQPRQAHGGNGMAAGQPGGRRRRRGTDTAQGAGAETAATSQLSDSDARDGDRDEAHGETAETAETAV